MRTVASLVTGKSWLFGPVAGLLCALLTTFIFTVWDWMSNPGGIFRDEAGTHWEFVYETAVSWFVPTFLYVAVLATLIHLCVGGCTTLYRRLVSSRSAGGK